MNDVAPGDRFSLWYRLRAQVVFELLHFAGPSHLDDARDPRKQIEREYLRRKALHQQRKAARRALQH